MSVPKERIGVKAVCDTCGWESEIHLDTEEGNINCANLSVLIETRLGHIKDSFIDEKKIHKIKLIEVF